MAQSIINSVSFLPSWFQLIFISMVPIIELRGAIPWGIFVLHYPIVLNYILCVLGSIIPAPFILLFIQSILRWMRANKYTRKFALWLDKKADKGSKKIQEYKFWGLMIFVAIPLPGTGVWTGCLAASVMEMSFKKAFISVTLGSMIAGIIVTVLCSLGLIAVS